MKENVKRIKMETINAELSTIGRQIIGDEEIVNVYDVQDYLDQEFEADNIDVVEYNVICELMQMQEFKIDYNNVKVNGHQECASFAATETELLSFYSKGDK